MRDRVHVGMHARRGDRGPRRVFAGPGRPNHEPVLRLGGDDPVAQARQLRARAGACPHVPHRRRRQAVGGRLPGVHPRCHEVLLRDRGVHGEDHDPTPPPMATASLHQLCDRESLFPGACYRYNSARLVYWFGDRTRVALECLRLEGAWRRGCFQGLGYTWLDAEPDRGGGGMHQQGDRDDKVACLEGLIEKLADLDRDKASRACGNLRRGASSGLRQRRRSADVQSRQADTHALLRPGGGALPRGVPHAGSRTQPSHHH